MAYKAKGIAPHCQNRLCYSQFTQSHFQILFHIFPRHLHNISNMANIWADQPFKLLPIPGQPGAPSVRFFASDQKPLLTSFQSENHGAQYMAWDMANAHNGLIRLLNAIYLQCDNVHKPEDIADMVFYIKCWGDDINHHHHCEETILFPQLDAMAKEAGINESLMNENVEQHHKFDVGLNQLREYIARVQAGNETYDGKAVKAYIDEFAPVLTEHLHAEIETLLKMERCDGAVLKKMFQDFVGLVVKGADMVSYGPCCVALCHPADFGSRAEYRYTACIRWLRQDHARMRELPHGTLLPALSERLLVL
jgi:hemerythrin-like domain-containing protein